MKYALAVVFVCLVFIPATPAFSQTLTYYYDETGNRTDKVIVLQKSALVSSSEKEAITDKEISTLDFSVLLYPNPTEGILKIEINPDSQNNPESIQVQIEIYDMTGRLMQRAMADFGMTVFDLSGYADGTYIMIIKDRERASRWKIIKR